MQQGAQKPPATENLKETNVELRVTKGREPKDQSRKRHGCGRAVLSPLTGTLRPKPEDIEQQQQQQQQQQVNIDLT
jgi:hypothetical protein